MKSIVLGAAMVVGLMAASTACASEDELAQKSGCLTCHAVDTKKVGPAFKQIAKDFKGKSDADVLARWKGQKVHASVKATDDDVKKILKWVATLQ